MVNAQELSSSDIEGVYQRSLIQYNGKHILKFAECNKDDTLFFMPDGTFKLHYGEEKCSEKDGDVDNGTWEIPEGEKAILIKSEIYGIDRVLYAKVLGLSDELLKIKYEMEDDGETVTWTEQLLPIK